MQIIITINVKLNLHFKYKFLIVKKQNKIFKQDVKV